MAILKLIALSALAASVGAVAWFGVPEDSREVADRVRATLMAQFAGARRSSAEPVWRWGDLERADIIAAVLATGTLRPVATVSVSAETTGQIAAIYADFNDVVERDQPIALIDPVLLEIAVEKAEADVETARAALETHLANMTRMEAALENVRADLRGVLASAALAALQLRDSESELARKRALAGSISAAELERAESSVEASGLQLRIAEAQVDSRRAAVMQAEADVRAGHSQLDSHRAALRHRAASLRETQIELERTVIRSPVDGVIIWRDAEVGQSVAGQQGIPLFTIAQDLRAMQVNASIDESEIGRIMPGQTVEFTVDAYRNQLFAGTVDQIRQTPQVQQNVVTYTVVVRAANPDLRLLPGMTANARFIIDRREQVFTVPNAALRFAPPDADLPAGRAIWVDNGGEGLRAIAVERGISDETHSEINGEGLEAGMRVVVGMERVIEGQPGGRLLVGGF